MELCCSFQLAGYILRKNINLVPLSYCIKNQQKPLSYTVTANDCLLSIFSLLGLDPTNIQHHDDHDMPSSIYFLFIASKSFEVIREKEVSVQFGSPKFPYPWTS